MQKNRVLLLAVLSVLLSLSLVGCANLGKKNAEAQGGAVVKGEGEGEAEDDTGELMWKMVALEGEVERIKAGEVETFFEGLEIEDFGEESEAEYRQWTDEKGVHHMEMKGPTDNPYFSAFEIHPDGTKAISFDADGNGKFAKMIEEKPDSKVYWVDRSGSGVFDERVSIRFFERTKGLWRMHYAFEKRKPDGTWGETREIGWQSHGHRSVYNNNAW